MSDPNKPNLPSQNDMGEDKGVSPAVPLEAKVVHDLELSGGRLSLGALNDLNPLEPIVRVVEGSLGEAETKDEEDEDNKGSGGEEPSSPQGEER